MSTAAGPSQQLADDTMGHNMTRGNRAENDSHNYAPAFLLSPEEVFSIIDSVAKQNETLLIWFRGERDTERKTLIREAISSFNISLNKLSSAYLSSLAAHLVNEMYRNDLVSTCKKLDQVVDRLNQVSATPAPTYANVIRQPLEPSRKITIVEGKSFPIKSRKQVVIGPTDANKDKFLTSKETKQALL
ncbi:hypothetical protein QAD02_003499 [Eretmocerus hayati]|uniref:Uncharacterized protein n=1 Tax=Eretmocerus hayati TaxID=131215 RepID=A0ACC2NRT5_9HYME|nr:hypothetical protein QAD02_003499 [Eretmocerus hayati]